MRCSARAITTRIITSWNSFFPFLRYYSLSSKLLHFLFLSFRVFHLSLLQQLPLEVVSAASVSPHERFLSRPIFCFRFFLPYTLCWSSGQVVSCTPIFLWSLYAFSPQANRGMVSFVQQWEKVSDCFVEKNEEKNEGLMQSDGKKRQQSKL